MHNCTSFARLTTLSRGIAQFLGNLVQSRILRTKKNKIINDNDDKSSGCEILIMLFQSPRSAVSEPEPESPGTDSGTDLRHDHGHHDQPQHREEGEHSEEEQDPKMQIPTIGIRSDLLPTHPVPKMDLDLNHLGSLQGLPALEALRRQAGNTNSFLANLPGSPINMPNFSQGRPSQPPTPQSTGSQDMGSGSWTFEEQFKQVKKNFPTTKKTFSPPDTFHSISLFLLLSHFLCLEKCNSSGFQF